MCPNIKKIDIERAENFTIIITDIEIMLKVEYIKEIYLGIDSNHKLSDELELLVNKYRTSLKGFRIRKLFSDK